MAKSFSKVSLINLYSAELTRIEVALLGYQDFDHVTPDTPNYHNDAKKYYSLLGEEKVISDLLKRVKKA